MQPKLIPIIPEATARALVTTQEAIAVIEATFAEYGRERRMLSDPPALHMKGARPEIATFKIKGARLPGRGIAGFRIIADRDLPTGEATIDYGWVADIETGQLLGLIEETALHRLRTAMTAVVTAKWVARPDSRVAAIIGAGHISAELPAGLKLAFDLDEVRIASRRYESAVAFATAHNATVPMRACRTVDEAIDGADIVIAISSAAEPVIHAQHVQKGITICGLGGGAEISLDTLRRADRFVVDDLTYAQTIGSVKGWLAAGATVPELQQRLWADIGDIATGAKPGRISADDSIVAVIQGMACCDIALAHRAVERAVETDLIEAQG